MSVDQWGPQKEALKDLGRIEGLQQVEVYYRIEETKAFDPTLVVLSAITLVITTISDHLISDIYESLKVKLMRIFHLREHASKSTFDITIVIKSEDTAITIQGKVKNDDEIAQLTENAKSIYIKLHEGLNVDTKQINHKELAVILSDLSQI